MSSAKSVSQWIAHLKAGDHQAAQRLWERYAAHLVQLARRRLKNSPKRIADEDDVVASVFHSLYRGATAGRLQDVNNRDELWWLLLAITKQKVIDHTRRELATKRGGGRIRHETDLNGYGHGCARFELDQLIGDEPTPEFLMMLQEQQSRLLSILRDDRLRRIALYRIEGLTVAEIAEALGLCERSVQRKLEIIRRAWSQELAP
jgi:RNA polymerase sigma factor (sigma-70 family)